MSTQVSASPRPRPSMVPAPLQTPPWPSFFPFSLFPFLFLPFLFFFPFHSPFYFIFTKPLGPSLGVNWMWTKMNDCASNEFFLAYVKKGSISKEEKKTNFDHSLVAYCFRLLFLQKEFYSISLSSTLAFFLPEHLLLPLPLQTPLDHVSGQCRPQNM